MLALAERPAGRWRDLSTRVVSALVLAPIGIVGVWVGGIAFTVIVVAVMLGLTLEWLGLCRRSRWPTLRPAGLVYVALSGAAMLWLRDDPVAGRADVLFLLLIVWAGDIGAYLVGRWVG